MDITKDMVREWVEHGGYEMPECEWFVDDFWNDCPRDQLKFAIENQIEVFEFNNWQCMEDKLGRVIPYETFVTISNAFWDIEVDILDLLSMANL